MYLVFYSTNSVFKAEEMLVNGMVSCRVVPTPVQDKAYCGVCINTQDPSALEIIQNIEYKVIEESEDVI